MRYASVCDGIGAAHVAWRHLGWECAWTSEIEPFPATVVDHHFAFKNVGDMTKITQEMLDELGPVELLVGGTPCQSFSVAGLRGGLDDPRGNLALRFVQLAAVLKPKWIVWENVPGVLSSGKGRDFGTVLGALGELGYGFAYRILDAQWFGVAQRRRRVFVVAHARDWRRAAAVLFERESVFGNPPTRGKAGQEVTGPIAGCSNGGGANGPGRTADEADTLIASSVTAKWSKGSGGPAGDECQNLVAFAQNARDEVRLVNGDGKIVGALAAEPGMKQTSFVAYDITGIRATVGGREPDCHTALRSRAPGQSEASTTTVVAIQERAVCDNPDAGPDGAGIRTDGVSFTLEARTVPQAVAFTTEQTPKFNDDCALIITRQSPTGGGQPQCVAFNTWGGQQRADRPNGGFYVEENAETSKTLDSQGGLNPSASQGGTVVAQGFTYSGYSNQPAWMTGDRTDCLPASGHSDSSQQGMGVLAFAQNQLGEVRTNSDIMGTVNTNQNASGSNTPMVAIAVRTAQTSANGHGVAEEVAHTLDQVQGQAIAFDGGNQSASDDIHHTLRIGRDSGDAIAFNAYQRTEGQATWPLGASDGRQVEVGVRQAMAVRRLTPRECERLQGFPDDYTLVTYRNKPAADGPRYKALGNSMAVPVMRWIGERIAELDAK
jgi:DNA (cytosine-5)-methyltransferase 1